MKVVVGLGNPGSQYAGTRHNVGWLVLDRLAERAGWTGRGRQRDNAHVAMGRYRGLDLMLVKPLTYMNDSGRAVRKVMAREHVPLNEILVVADDFALPFGKLRFREAGSHGGHNGLRSIIEELGTEKFSRLRVGIGDPVRNGRDHVLSTLRTRRGPATRRAARRGRGRGRGVGSRGHEQGIEPLERVPAPRRRCRSAGAAGCGRRPARRDRGPPHEDRLAAGPARSRSHRCLTARPGRPRPSGAGAGATAGSRSRSPASSPRATRRPATRTRSTSTWPTWTPRWRTPPRADGPSPGRRWRRGPHRPPALRRGGPRAPTACPTCRPCRRCWRRPAPSARCASGSGPPATSVASGRHAGLVAVPHGAKSYLAAAIAIGEPLIWIARDAEIGDRVAEELAAWLGDPAAVAVLEPRTALAYERSELVADETAARVAALAAWRSGRARVLVASVQALLQHTIAPADVPEHPRELATGTRLHQEALLRELFDLGYVPVVEVAGRGEFARRGGIVDVFPPSLDLPVRIEFFGDEIDSLRAFDPTDQRATGRSSAPSSCPRPSSCTPRGRGRDPRAPGSGRRPPPRAAHRRPRPVRRRRRRPAPGRSDGVRASRRSGDHGGRRGRGVGGPARAGDAARPRRAGHVAGPRRAGRSRRGRRLPVAPGRRAPDGAGGVRRTAEGLALDVPAAARLEGPPRRRQDARADLGIGAAGRGRDGVRRARIGRPVRLARTGAAVRPRRSTRRGGRGLARGRARIVLASDQAPRLADLLHEAGHEVAVVERVVEAPPPGAITLVGRSLNGGFAGGPDGLVFVTDRELFGTVRVRRPKALRRVVPRDILERLAPGDLVVHIDHGVARYERMLRRGGQGEDRDYLELSFAGGDRIFVPVEQIARVTRYSGGERPALSKLGGTEWLRAKQRVRKAVTELADELLALYATRSAAQGHAFSDDTPWQAEMEASFPYEETADQLRAALEVKADMERQQPMDRLVVGDVGYGKTEVALRAAFKAIQDERQVAVLVPTTVLAAQHHATFSQRFAAFPIEVRLLSRFVPAGSRRPRSTAWPTGRWISSSGRIACSARTCDFATWASSSSTRSSGSASPPRSGSSSSAARSTCSPCPRRRSRAR